MADNQAEDDDDESFGDFKFVPFPNQPLHSSHDNDDWGDFMNHSNNQIDARFEQSNEYFRSHLPSKPSDRFGVPPDSTEKNSFHENELTRVQESEKPKWTKPLGAIPLSIFGDEEEEEPVSGNPGFSDSANVFPDKSGDTVSSESNSNGAVKINDLIAHLYNQSPGSNSENENGSIAVLSGTDLNFSGAISNGTTTVSTVDAPNLDINGLSSHLSNLNLDSADGNEDVGDDDDGWEFQCAEAESRIRSESIKVVETKHEPAPGAGCTSAFDSGADDAVDKLDSSRGISDKASEWNQGFNFSPSFELQDTKTGLTIVNNDFGKFKDTHLESASNHNLEGPKLADMHPASAEALKFNVQGPSDPDNQSLASGQISHQSDEWDFGFNINPHSLGEDHHISESYSKSKQNDDDKDLNASPTNLFPFEDEVEGIGNKHEKSKTSSEKHKEVLPLSLFGDETPNTDDNPIYQDFSLHAPTCSIRNSFDGPGSHLSINDLIWNMYSEPEDKSSPNNSPKGTKIGIHATSAVSGSNLVNGDGDLNEDSWEFKDASSETAFRHESAQNTSNHALQFSENGLHPSATILNSDLINGDNGSTDDSWEFKDGFSGTRIQVQASFIDHGDSLTQLSTKVVEPLNYVDFYGKLKDWLCDVIPCNLQNLKKAQNVAALSDEDAKAKALQEEIQEFSDILHQHNIIPDEHLSDDHSPRNMCLDELLKVLKEPKFQSLESEYQLTSRLSMAEKNMKAAIELLKDVASTLRILELRTRDEQSTCFTSWSKIAFVCCQELKHGALIWKQSVERNVQNHLLSNPKGFQYILALGEIYRVAEVIGVSTKLYKPWMLVCSLDPTKLFTLLSECYTIWSGSGLEEAISSMSNQNNFEQETIPRELLKSINGIHKLDERALQSYVISGQKTTCQLSALPAGLIPGLKIVTWNGKPYFLTLANLWANLISSDPPE